MRIAKGEDGRDADRSNSNLCNSKSNAWSRMIRSLGLLGISAEEDSRRKDKKDESRHGCGCSRPEFIASG